MRPFWDKNDILSNYAETPFTMKLGGTSFRYRFGEQAFQEAKVRFVLNKLPNGDPLILKGRRIIDEIRHARDADHARTLAKKIERQPFQFDSNAWGKAKKALMKDVLSAKIAQSPQTRAALLATGDDILVEASKYDNSWGVSLAADDPRIQDSDNWGRGLVNGRQANARECNLLGKYWMEIRDNLKRQAIRSS